MMAPPNRLAVFLLHLTVSLLKTELANPPKLVLAPECLAGLDADCCGGVEKLCWEPVMDGVEGIADGWDAGAVP